jgi:hypothetical protein
MLIIKLKSRLNLKKKFIDKSLFLKFSKILNFHQFKYFIKSGTKTLNKKIHFI